MSVEETAVEAPEDTLNVLVPTGEHVTWTIGNKEGGGDYREYVQKPLSYFRKMQFFALTSGVLRQALAVGGQGALSEVLTSFGELRERASSLTADDLHDAEAFVSLATGLLVYVPDYLESAYCIWLNVPQAERRWAVATMAEHEDDGGLSDEDGIEIIKVFIAQNWDAIKHFFGVLLPGIWTTAQAQMKTEETTTTVTSEETEAPDTSLESPQSKPSSTTLPDTPRL